VSAIDRLVDAGLLFRQGMPPQANYLFKHALVQDAAYSTLRFHIRHALDPIMPGHGIPIDPATPGDDAAAHALSPPRARKRRRRPRRVGAFARRVHRGRVQLY
jgi:hypothetical protein